jgi:(1->4)-alpha-D-glucan 1-alpha-D-glucosylmutase
MPRQPRLTKQDLAHARRIAATPPTPPGSTYRIQFNSSFTFEDATAVLDYLTTLGIGALYASPLLASTPGSMHGYDVVDYRRIDPEIGGPDGFADLTTALRDRQLGLLLDFVPNHMGIVLGANPWWQDVLERGQESRYADYFDIDWQPLKSQMQHQVLVPVLGDHFGLVLERGELRLAYEDGSFTVHYFETPLPIAPPTYPMILAPAVEAVRAQLEADDLRLLEFESVCGAFERLPPNTSTDPEMVSERQREEIVTKRRLSQLLESEPPIAEAIDASVATINGQAGDRSSFDALESLLNAQSYRPAYWRVASDEINYRRFFAINELAAIRQEFPGVFADTHRLTLDLVGQGDVTGLRIDHPDGLWDPAGYFHDLQRGAYLARVRAAIGAGKKQPIDDEAWGEWQPELLALWEDVRSSETGATAGATQNLYVVVEKILEHGETVPPSWAVAGTVGYEFARVTTGLFVDQTSRKSLDDFYARYIGQRIRSDDLVYEQKKLIMRVALASEVNVLAHALDRLTEHNRRTRDFTLNTLRNAMREIIACFPVYRTYTVCEGSDVSSRDRRFVNAAVDEALRRNPASGRSVFELIRSVLLLDFPEDATPEQRDEICHFVMKFQQLSGPVMAKGLEDTAFYRYNRLLSLNEVGGDPSTFGTSVAEFHRECQSRAQKWPGAMLLSSTHDTKRSEDVRTRIIAISEIPREWRAAVNRWSRMNRKHKTRIAGAMAPDRNDEYHLYQTLVGIWPFAPEVPDESLAQRATNYMVKTVREAQVHSSWISPNEEYENALSRFVAGILEPKRRHQFVPDMTGFAQRTSRIGAFSSLSQQALKLTAPGVPDIYQGTELWDFSLVDPDNRRPVDFARRASMLQALNERAADPGLHTDLLDDLPSGAIKLFVTQRILKHRAHHHEVYAEGDYTPLETAGAHAERIIAFRRQTPTSELVIVAPRLVEALLKGDRTAPIGDVWEDTTVSIPGSRTYTDVFTGRHVKCISPDETACSVSDLLAAFPVAVLWDSGSRS